MDKDKKRSPILRGLFGIREKRSEEDSSSSSGFTVMEVCCLEVSQTPNMVA